MSPESSAPPLLTRRHVLLGGLGTAAVLLGACGSSDDAGDGSDELGLTPSDSDALVLVQIFPASNYAVSTVPQRLVFGLGQAAGPLVNDGIPDALEVQLEKLGDDGERVPVGSPLTVARHNDGVPQSYYPLRTTFDEVGTYTAVATTPDGSEINASFEVVGPAALKLAQPQSKIPAAPTPTTADPLGVAAICTRDPECPLHELSLPDAVATGKPTALLISTPEFCQTAACGPVLELFVQQRDAYPDVQFIHCEVYLDESGPDGGELIPAINDLGLTFEPSLFLVGGDGVIVDRLDTAFDRTELVEGLNAIS